MARSSTLWGWCLVNQSSSYCVACKFEEEDDDKDDDEDEEEEDDDDDNVDDEDDDDVDLDNGKDEVLKAVDDRGTETGAEGIESSSLFFFFPTTDVRFNIYLQLLCRICLNIYYLFMCVRYGYCFTISACGKGAFLQRVWNHGDGTL